MQAFRIVLALCVLAVAGGAQAQDEDEEEEQVAELGTYQVGTRPGVQLDDGNGEIKLEVGRPQIRFEGLGKPQLDIELPPPGGDTVSGAAPQRVQEPLAISTPAPDYPTAAARRGLEGRVTVAFTINAAGGTESIEIVDAQPRGVFEDAARDAVARWLFKPYRVNGKPQPKRVQQTIDFSLQQGQVGRVAEGAPAGGASRAPVPVNTPAPLYPRDAARRGVEGSVVVEFTITAVGDTADIEIVESNPPGVFDAEVRRTVGQWKFQPALENGRPAEKRVRQTIDFNL